MHLHSHHLGHPADHIPALLAVRRLFPALESYGCDWIIPLHESIFMFFAQQRPRKGLHVGQEIRGAIAPAC